MKTHFNPKNNPRVIIIQKLYGKFYNEDNDIEFPKHRFKKFIKDIVFGTIERNDLILDELNNKLGDEFVLDNLDKVFQTILKAATYEFLYKPKKFVKGTKMNFAGLKKVQDRANIVLFFREQSENPVPLP